MSISAPRPHLREYILVKFEGKVVKVTLDGGAKGNHIYINTYM